MWHSKRKASDAFYFGKPPFKKPRPDGDPTPPDEAPHENRPRPRFSYLLLAPEEGHNVPRTLNQLEADPEVPILRLGDTFEAGVVLDCARFIDYSTMFRVFDEHNTRYNMKLLKLLRINDHILRGELFFNLGWTHFVNDHNLGADDQISFDKNLDTTISDDFYYILKYVKKPESIKKPGNGAESSRKQDDGAESSRKLGDGAESSTKLSVDGAESSKKPGDGAESREYPGYRIERSKKLGDGAESNKKPGDGAESSTKLSDDGAESSRKPGDGAENRKKPGDSIESSTELSDDGAESSRKPGDGAESRKKPGDSIESSTKLSDDGAESSRKPGDGAESSTKLSDDSDQSVLGIEMPVFKVIYHRVLLETPSDQEHINAPRPGSRPFQLEAFCLSKTLTAAEFSRWLYFDVYDAIVLTDNPRVAETLPGISMEFMVFDRDDRQYCMTLRHFEMQGGIIGFCLDGWDRFLRRNHDLNRGDLIAFYKFLDRRIHYGYYYVVLKLPADVDCQNRSNPFRPVSRELMPGSYCFSKILSEDDVSPEAAGLQLEALQARHFKSSRRSLNELFMLFDWNDRQYDMKLSYYFNSERELMCFLDIADWHYFVLYNNLRAGDTIYVNKTFDQSVCAADHYFVITLARTVFHGQLETEF